MGLQEILGNQVHWDQWESLELQVFQVAQVQRVRQEPQAPVAPPDSRAPEENQDGQAYLELEAPRDQQAQMEPLEAKVLLGHPVYRARSD